MKKIGQHIILILLFLIIPIVSSPDFDGTLSVIWVSLFQREFFRSVLVVVFFYLNLNLSLLRFYYKKKYLLSIACILICFGIMVFLPNYLVSEIHPFSRGMLSPSMSSPRRISLLSMEEKFFHYNFGNTKIVSYSQIIFSALFPFLFSFLSSLFIFKNIEKKELERSKAKAELLNLKYQLQPHFLFSTLNSIYSLTLFKSDAAPNGILKLSNIMRYIVQESSKNLVKLSREIEYLNDYIALQLIRTDQNLDFSYIEKGETKDLQISPFILINFIENAFKYGFNAEEDSKISVKILIEGDVLHFRVFNNIVNRNTVDENSSKIGLKNTIEHLRQIYPGKYTLNIHHDGKTFEVNLKINLN